MGRTHTHVGHTHTHVGCTHTHTNTCRAHIRKHMWAVHKHTWVAHTHTWATRTHTHTHTHTHMGHTYTHTHTHIVYTSLVLQLAAGPNSTKSLGRWSRRCIFTLCSNSGTAVATHATNSEYNRLNYTVIFSVKLLHACVHIYIAIYIYTVLKGSKAKSNKGLCSGLKPRDLATSAPSLGLIEDILLMSARVWTLLLVGQQYIRGSSLIDLLEHMHTLSMMISEHNISNRDSSYTYIHTIHHDYRA